MRKKIAAAAPRAATFPAAIAAFTLLALALVAAVAVYRPGLSSPFLFDDDRYVHRNATLLRVWPPEWIHAGTQETRPLTNLSFALDIAAFGSGPLGHHIVNLALHLLGAVLLFALVWRMWRAAGRSGAPLAGAVAALVLALHPAQSGSVLYIQGRPGLLATTFGLAATLAAVESIRGWERSRRHAPGAVAVAFLVALAALSKESGAVVPALVLLYDVAFGRRADPRGFRVRLARLHLPAWAGLLPLALVYRLLHNPHAGVFASGVVDPARFYATQPTVLLFDLGLCLWPHGLTIDRAFPLLSPADPRAWASGLALLAVVALLVWALRRSPWLGFWGLWWLAPLAPTALVPSPEFAADRFLGMTLPGIAALAAWAAGGLAAWAAPRVRQAPQTLLVAIAVLLALPLGWATLGRARVWRSDLALWREATRVSPRNSRAWYQYARLLYAEDSLEAAEDAVHRALAIGVPNHLPFLLLSDVKATKGEADSSVFFARLAVEAAPGRSDAHVGLARAFALVARWPETEREAAAALAIDPASRPALYLRGRARAETGDLRGARGDQAALARLAGAGVEAATLAGSIATRSGQTAEADQSLARALERAPDDRDESLAYIDALRLRAPVLLSLGRADEAVRAWQDYFAVTGAERWDAASLAGQARALRAAGREREAETALRRAAALLPDSAARAHSAR